MLYTLNIFTVLKIVELAILVMEIFSLFIKSVVSKHFYFCETLVIFSDLLYIRAVSSILDERGISMQTQIMRDSKPLARKYATLFEQ